MSGKSLNQVMLIGNVTRDPELRYTPQGNAVATFGLATNRSWKTENGEIREEAEFHRLVAWNKLAELCSQLCTKGRKIYVQGRLQTRSFTGSDTLQHTITEIVIDDMILLDSRPSTGSSVTTGITPTAQPEVQEKVEEEAKPEVEEPALSSVEGKKGKKTKAAEEVDEAKPVAKAEVKEDINADDIPF